MGDLRALANGEKQEENEALTIRNQMYSLLKQTVDEIRNCGKFVFWRNEKRVLVTPVNTIVPSIINEYLPNRISPAC